KREDQERLVCPGGRSLYVLTHREPAFGTLLVARLDGQGREPFIAGKQELRLADRGGDVERLAVLPSTPLVVPSALVDLRQDDQRDGQVAALAEPAVHLGRGLGRLDAFVVVAGQRAMSAGERAVEPGLLELVAD